MFCKKSAEIACKKKLFDEQSSPTWSARKKFSNDFRTQNLLSKTSLGPWVSAESNGVVVRCVNHILLHQMCGGSNFYVLELMKTLILEGSNVCQNVEKWLFLEVKFFFERF